MAKRNLKRSMFFLDVIVLLAIFFSVFLLFELVIKKILIKYNVNKFYESMRTVQFDLTNSISYIEEKKELIYKDNAIDIFNYIKMSTLKRSKYDNSIVAIIFPKDENILFTGKRDEPDIKIDSKYLDYEFFSKEIIKQDELNKKNKVIDNNYVTFYIKSREYIGVAKFTDIGIRKNLSRDINELINPIIIIADRSDEFFFLINNVRNVFITLLVVVFGIGAFFKIFNTFVVSQEIKDISDRMTLVSNQIKQTGVITGKLQAILTKFVETTNLDLSFLGLVKSLEDLGAIITGMADKDLLAASLKNDNSLLNPHDEMMAIIFLDVQGFTTISEKHKDDIMIIINSIWINVEEVIARRFGKINKYEGDACLIIFREVDNKSNIHTALNAFYAGIEMLEKVPKICKQLNIEFNFRVGIDYGKVTYGKTGTDNKFELGVIGDPVNTAARFEALNKQYQTNFLITDTAFVNTNLNTTDLYSPKDELGQDITIKCIKIDRARPKGKSEAKGIFTVLKNQSDSFCFVGSDKYFKDENFDFFIKLNEIFINSISYWQKYHEYKMKNALNSDTPESLEIKNNAEKYWSDIARKFAQFYNKTKFPPAEHFIRTLIKFEEFDDYQKDPENWFKKDVYKVKSPSEDWIRLGVIELSK